MNRAKQFLIQYQSALIRARRLQAQIDALKDQRDSIGQSFDQERVQSTPKTDKIGELVAKITDLTLDLMDAEADQLMVMLDVEDVINRVSDPTCQLLLHARYIQLKKWSFIAEEMDYSYRGILKVHERALKEVDKLI